METSLKYTLASGVGDSILTFWEQHSYVNLVPDSQYGVLCIDMRQALVQSQQPLAKTCVR